MNGAFKMYASECEIYSLKWNATNASHLIRTWKEQQKTKQNKTYDAKFSFLELKR